LIRTPIFDPGTFRALVQAAQAVEGAFPGPAWRIAHAAEGVEVYEFVPTDAGWFHERLAAYEQSAYAELMVGVCGADGRVRPRTAAVVRDGGGVFRQMTRPTPVGSSR